MEQEPKTENINQKLRKEILDMMDKDQEMLKGEYDNLVIRRNTERIKEIIKQYGWPGRSLIGVDGSNAAWLLVQHSDHDFEFQKETLSLLKEAVEKGEASKRNLAYLIDRVRVNFGELQLFGTQFQKEKIEPQPIENEERLDERRKEFNLEPFEEYRKKMEELRKEELRKKESR